MTKPEEEDDNQSEKMFIVNLDQEMYEQRLLEQEKEEQADLFVVEHIHS